MADPGLVIAIDIGTTGVKVAAVDAASCSKLLDTIEAKRAGDGG